MGVTESKISELEVCDIESDWSHGRFISVRDGSTFIGISTDMVELLACADGDRFVLALDDRDRPWVGTVDVENAHVPAELGPQVRVRTSSGNYVYSSKVQMKLRRFAPSDPSERRRLYWTGEEKTVELQNKTEVTVYRVTPKNAQEGEA